MPFLNTKYKLIKSFGVNSKAPGMCDGYNKSVIFILILQIDNMHNWFLGICFHMNDKEPSY